MKFKISGIIICTLLFLFVACKKDKSVVAPAPAPVLSVKLAQQYLAAAQVDSAFAIWNVNGHQQRIKMVLRNDSLLAGMNLFEEGNGNLSIHIFSNKKFNNQYYSQWISKKTVSLQKNKGLNYDGPSSFFDAAWLPRAELKDAIGHEAIVALRPDDAYFFIKDPRHATLKLTMERSYWKTTGGIQLAGAGVWECTAGCTGVENHDYFNMLPGRIGTRPWNHITVILLFETDHNGGGWIISLEHDL